MLYYYMFEANSLDIILKEEDNLRFSPILGSFSSYAFLLKHLLLLLQCVFKCHITINELIVVKQVLRTFKLIYFLVDY